MAIGDRTRAKMRANAAPLLEPGESIQAVFGGQTVNQWLIAPSVLVPVVFLVLFAVNRYRVVVVTDRRILVCRSGRFRMTPVKGILAELPRATRIGPPGGTWWRCDTLGGRLYIGKTFHKDIQAADSAPAGPRTGEW
jgi:hypothetical protein